MLKKAVANLHICEREEWDKFCLFVKLGNEVLNELLLCCLSLVARLLQPGPSNTFNQLRRRDE